MPPLRSSTVCRPSSSARTAALHSLSAGVLTSSGESGHDFGTTQRRHRLGRLPSLRQRVQQSSGRRGHLGDGSFEHVHVGRGRASDAADLAYVLAGGGFDFLRGRRGFQTAQLGDVPAHASTIGRRVDTVGTCRARNPPKTTSPTDRHHRPRTHPDPEPSQVAERAVVGPAHQVLCRAGRGRRRRRRRRRDTHRRRPGVLRGP